MQVLVCRLRWQPVDRSILAIVYRSEAQAFGAGSGGLERREPSDKNELPARTAARPPLGMGSFRLCEDV